MLTEAQEGRHLSNAVKKVHFEPGVEGRIWDTCSEG
jgi:hypothetical protein